MQINKYSTKDEVSAAAGEGLHQLLMANKNKPVLLLLSGGSALSILEYVSKQGTGEHLTIAMLDERFSQDKAVNNFLQFQKTDFFTFALETETNFYGSIPRKDETKEMMAARLEKNFRAWKEQNPAGLIIAVLGMGSDGHTAGIFPETDVNKFNQLFNGQALVVAYDALGKHEHTERITSTLPMLKTATEAIIFVTGPEKKEKLDLTLAQKGKINELPALVWHEIKNAKVYTDIE